ncbi:TPA: diaminopropionate ammonia-lyase [Escherichia coli]|nr:diaminopropionate ammonia-lyase [Escherichia coli]
MLENISFFINQTPFTRQPSAPLAPFNHKELAKALKFHRTIPGYAPTPLYTLPALSQKLGVKNIYLKDESQRFGLKAFKALGGAYAMACHIAELLGKDIDELPFDVMTSDNVRHALKTVTFATTTDGNHGRGVAWMARQLNQNAVVYMPKGSSPQRLASIRNEGARAEIVDMNYDNAVRMTAEQAKKHGWIVIQDTTWEGYEKIPLWIMQGYGTLMLEVMTQLHQVAPTHIVVQAGVGSFAGMVQGMVTAAWGDYRPKVIVAEALMANCLYRSARAKEGYAVAVGGDLQTIMAGLACGEANSIGWKLLRDYATAFASCPDDVARLGMRMLGNPLTGDPQIISGESGAVTAGLLALLMTSPALRQIREQLGLDAHSRVLLISTEGDTDPQQYLDIVWNDQNLIYQQ